MSYTEIKGKNQELDQLFDSIYDGKEDSRKLNLISRFIEIIIDLADSSEITKDHAGYIITDVLLKYYPEDKFESVFDIASELELAQAQINTWSEKEINDEWNALKSRFKIIKSGLN